MPKKKANNRLDKLFDEINKETQLQDENPATLVKKTSKETASESLDLLHPVDFSGGAKKSPAPSDASLPISTMLSTAFRTNERNWATLKIVDESEQRTWGSEEQMLVKQVADQLSLALENARLFEESKKSAHELSVLNEFGSELATLEKIKLSC